MLYCSTPFAHSFPFFAYICVIYASIGCISLTDTRLTLLSIRTFFLFPTFRSILRCASVFTKTLTLFPRTSVWDDVCWQEAHAESCCSSAVTNCAEWSWSEMCPGTCTILISVSLSCMGVTLISRTLLRPVGAQRSRSLSATDATLCLVILHPIFVYLWLNTYTTRVISAVRSLTTVNKVDFLTVCLRVLTWTVNRAACESNEARSVYSWTICRLIWSECECLKIRF